MAIRVTERWSGPLLAYATSSYRARRMFDVSGVSSQADAIAAVVAFDPQTAYNATHPNSSIIYVDDQDAGVVGFNVYSVTITYSSNPAGRHIDPGNPLLEPIRYRFEWQNITQGSDRDNYGNKFQNAAGQSFLTDVPTDVLNGFLIAERNEPFYDAISAVSLSNAVNNVAVTFNGMWNLDKGQACVRKIVPLTPITSAAVYCTVQYVIELRRGFKLDSDGYWDGFKARIENDGVQGWWSNSGTATSGPICELINGAIQKTSMPVRLDSTGIPMLKAIISGGSITNTGRYFIGIPTATSGLAAATPVARPSSVLIPATTILENAGDAYFVKAYPETVVLSDLNVLGL